MRIKFATAFIMLLLGGSLINFLPTSGLVDALQAADIVRIYGWVNKPLNLTRAELFSFPMVSEVARLQCVMGIPDVTYNWTGIPLFHLLTLAQIRLESYKIVTRGSGSFESDLLVEEALQPTTILALEANGTNLPDIDGVQGSFRLVVPCKWGYKWVGDVQEIEVVNTDYKGTYESSGWDDAGDIPDCGPLPTTTPSLVAFHLPYGNRTFEVKIFTNVSIDAFTFDYYQKKLEVDVTVPLGTTSFADFVLAQGFLKGPYNVTLDDYKIDVVEANVIQRSYLYLPVGQGNHTVRIFGTEFFGHIPEIMVDYNGTVDVGQTVIFNASRSVDYGEIVSYEWDFGDGINGTGEVVQHSYGKEGTYEVRLNATNNEGISNFATLPVIVERPPESIPSTVRLLLLAVLVLLILMFGILLRNRRSETEDVPAVP
ncbi:MAG TPA: PKD domain-containing protein [Patescibacteria group bacterium]|nr:PKD domain-containing protein [Patescibacteria group bacterium]